MIKYIFFLMLILSNQVEAHDEFLGKYISNYDGDTFIVNIDNVPEIFGKAIPVRIVGIDTPEIKSSVACEREVAKSARDYLKSILSVAKEIKITNLKRDKYFRIDAVVLADGKDVSLDLLSKKLAVKYGVIVNWCDYK